MATVKVHVAVLSADDHFNEATVAALADCARQDTRQTSGLDFAFISVRSAVEVVALALRDGWLQAVVIDSRTTSAVGQVIAELRRARAELDLFLMVAGDDELSDLRVALLDRDEDKPSQLYRQLRRAIQHRAKTPFADTLLDYVYSAKDAWHTPGHSGGDSLRDSPWVADFYRMMGEHIFSTDLSVSVQSLDSLLEPHSVIQEAQDLAAKAFGSRRTFFVTNGTSTANKVIIQHLLGAGGKIILDQACHKSVHHAVILFGAEPVYLEASVNLTYGFYGPVPKQRIMAAIDAHPDARLLVLTSCTYDGFYYDLAPIIAYAHEHGIKVLIDEAWYAHGRFHPSLRPNALDCGADYVTQSTHKMLSAFSQASMIHVADPDFNEYRFREDLNMHTSTSPQYAMIASLDVARKQMSMEGFRQLSRCIDIAGRLRQGINKTVVFRVLELEQMLPAELKDDNVRLDPTKLSIDVSASGLSARKVQLALFEDFGIQLEKVTHNTLTALVTLGSTESKVLRLVNALQKLAVGAISPAHLAPRRVTALPAMSEFRLLPREAYFGASTIVPLLSDQRGVNPSLIGAICADQVVPYPPGIPVLNPGQIITAGIAGYLADLYHSNSGIEIHGLIVRAEQPCLRVVQDPMVGALAGLALG